MTSMTLTGEFWHSFTLSLFRSTDYDHVKDNFPSILLWIWAFGKMKLEEFKDLIFVTDYKMCESKMEKNPSWYPLTLDVFVKFLQKVIFLFIFLEYFFPILWPFLIIFFVCFREGYPTRWILQQGCIVRPVPRLSHLLLRFGILWQKPKIGWSKAFDLGTLRSSLLSPTKTITMTSSTRCHSCLCVFILLFIFL